MEIWLWRQCGTGSRETVSGSIGWACSADRGGGSGVAGWVRGAILTEEAPSALSELPTAARGAGMPTPLTMIVARVSAMMLRWAVARVKKGRLVRQSTQVRQMVVAHQVAMRSKMGREGEGEVGAVRRSLSMADEIGVFFIGLCPRSCDRTNNGRQPRERLTIG